MNAVLQFLGVALPFHLRYKYHGYHGNESVPVCHTHAGVHLPDADGKPGEAADDTRIVLDDDDEFDRFHASGKYGSMRPPPRQDTGDTYGGHTQRSMTQESDDVVPELDDGFFHQRGGGDTGGPDRLHHAARGSVLEFEDLERLVAYQADREREAELQAAARGRGGTATDPSDGAIRIPTTTSTRDGASADVGGEGRDGERGRGVPVVAVHGLPSTPPIHEADGGCRCGGGRLLLCLDGAGRIDSAGGGCINGAGGDSAGGGCCCSVEDEQSVGSGCNIGKGCRKLHTHTHTQELLFYRCAKSSFLSTNAEFRGEVATWRGPLLEGTLRL